MSHSVSLARDLTTDEAPLEPGRAAYPCATTKPIEIQVLVRRRADQGEGHRPKVRWAKARNPWKRPRG